MHADGHSRTQKKRKYYQSKTLMACKLDSSRLIKKMRGNFLSQKRT
jgi:hypothetical protein